MLKYFFIIILLLSLSGCRRETAQEKDINNGNENVVQLPSLTFDASAIIQEFRRIYPTNNISNEIVAQGGVLRLPMILNHTSYNAFEHHFAGVFIPFMDEILPISKYDQIIGSILMPPLLLPCFTCSELFMQSSQSPLSLNMDAANKTITLTMPDDIHIYWSDGVLLTLKDLYFAYHFAARMGEAPMILPLRAGNPLLNIVGVEDFNAGHVDYIRGLTLSDDFRTLDITFIIYPTPQLIMDMPFIPLPMHHLANLSFMELLTHPNIGFNALSYGVFTLDNIIHGERILLRANHMYWQGAPLLDGIEFIVMDEMDAMSKIISGEIDVLSNVGGMVEQEHAQTMLGNFSNQSALLYFNLGVINNRLSLSQSPTLTPRSDNHPISNPSFRRAIAYVLNPTILTNMIPHTMPATSTHHPYNAYQYINFASPGLSTFDISRANEILDAIGFSWSDEFRTDENGSPFYVNIVLPMGSLWEQFFTAFQADLKMVGIDLRLYGDKFINFSSLRSIVGGNLNANSDMHMFFMFSELAITPFPFLKWSLGSMDNWGGFSNPSFDEIINDMNTLVAWDNDLLMRMYEDLDMLLNEYVPAIPLFWAYTITALNPRVKNWAVTHCASYEKNFAWHRVSVAS